MTDIYNEASPDQHIIATSNKLSHSNLSEDMDYDEKIDAFNAAPFLDFINEEGDKLRDSLPKRKDKILPDIQILTKFFMDCKSRFPGISAMLIYDELTDLLGISPAEMWDNLPKQIKGQLVKELKGKVSLDKYNKKVNKEFISRNGAIQPSLNSTGHSANV